MEISFINAITIQIIISYFTSLILSLHYVYITVSLKIKRTFFNFFLFCIPNLIELKFCEGTLRNRPDSL